MKSDFEKIGSVIACANMSAPGEELAFTFPEVIEAIGLCSANHIAVLGVEVFRLKEGGFYASGCSTYDLQMHEKWPRVAAAGWSKYLGENNTLAEEFVKLDPRGDDHVYVLTTSSWREFCEVQEMKRQRLLD